MKTKIKNNKGITLIALIITIIIMLILVAITINVVINSGLITSAKNAVDKTKAAYEQEKQIEGQIKVGDKKLSIEDYIGELGEKNPLAGTRVTAKTKYEDGGKTAWIPAGFTVSGNYKERTIDGGLVIYLIPTKEKDATKGKTDDEIAKIDWNNGLDALKTTYDQFVWIPVEEGKYERTDWDKNEKSATALNTTYKEPLSGYDEDETGKTGLEPILNAMATSVSNNGGFYIARYEAGVTEPRSSGQAVDIAIRPLFIQDAYPYNYITWGAGMKDASGGAVELCNTTYNNYLNNNGYGANCMLCSGVAWDCMLDFIKDDDHVITETNKSGVTVGSTSWGNYKDADFDVRSTAKDVSTMAGLQNNHKSNGNTILLTTGASEQNKSKNIYDIAGNCAEWTTEARGSLSRILRGGFCDIGGSGLPASNRIGNNPWGTVVLSFRPTLFVK